MQSLYHPGLASLVRRPRLQSRCSAASHTTGVLIYIPCNVCTRIKLYHAYLLVKYITFICFMVIGNVVHLFTMFSDMFGECYGHYMIHGTSVCQREQL